MLKAITKLGLASRFRTMTPPSSSPEPTGATKWFRGVSLARCRSAASFSPRACVDGRRKSEVAPRRMPGRNVSAEQRWIDLAASAPESTKRQVHRSRGGWYTLILRSRCPYQMVLLPCWATFVATRPPMAGSTAKPGATLPPLLPGATWPRAAAIIPW